jgi:hypothetical protein
VGRKCPLPGEADGLFVNFDLTSAGVAFEMVSVCGRGKPILEAVRDEETA